MTNMHANIIITGKSLETKFYKIKQKYIDNFGFYKKIFIGAVIAVFVIISGLSYTTIRTKFTEKKLKNNIVQLKSELDNRQIDKMLDNLNNAESTLSQIETYLNQHNIKTLPAQDSTGGVGGEHYPVTLETTENKLNRMNDLFDKIQHIPLGVPYNGRTTSTFGYRRDPFNYGSEFHSGLDLSGTIGDKIRATAAGTVSVAGWTSGYGNCIIIDHGYGYQTRYGHLSAVKVEVGQKVNAGDVIGLLGSTGRSNGPHVHYEVIYNNQCINPINFLKIN